MTAPHPILEQLRAERRTRGLRQKDAAHLAGLATSSLGYWETGTRQPTLDGLDLYVRALGFRLVLVPVADETDEAEPGEQLPFGELALDPCEKYCPGCGQARHRRAFHTDRHNRDGLYRVCKHCRRDRRERALEAAAGERGAA